MKTNYHFLLKNFRFLSFSLLIISLSACSSFRNSSVDDSDGIYSSSPRETIPNENQTYAKSKPTNVYVEKFNQIQEDFEESQYFTDVDAYSSNPVDTVYVVEQSYAGWGNNSSDININYYNNGWNNWGWNNWGWGWNSWYGPGWNNGFFYGNVGWGLGWNNWGWNNWGWNGWYGNNWGWNNWGWNGWYSPYGGGYYNNNVAYNRGRRGINGNYNNAGRSTSRTATVLGRNTQIGNATVRSSRTRSNTISTNPRSTTTRFNNRSTTSPTRSTTTRSTTTPTRSTTTPTRTSSPTRSGGNIGGGRSSGGSSGGGGRSSGGGGGRSGGGGRGGRG